MKMKSIQKLENIDLLEQQKSKLCLSCQACCKLSYVEVSQSLNNQANLTFLAFKGFQFFESNLHLFLILKSPCKHLSPKGCKIYSERPVACKTFDGRKDPWIGEICKWSKLKKEV